MSSPAEPDKLFEITILRHGESIGNFENRLQGQMDYPLTELGIRQAEALANRWISSGICFDHIISSPLSRAYQTATIIAEKLNINQIETDPLWMERDMGVFSGQTFFFSMKLTIFLRTLSFYRYYILGVYH